MNRRAIVLIVLAAFFAVPASTQDKNHCKEFSITGELRAGEGFRREIGNELSFRIDPWKDSGGWEFEIGPTAPSPKEWDQYVYPLTPPYRFGGAREVNTGWGVTAQDAVRNHRQFWFLLSRDDAVVATSVIDNVLWPKSETDQMTALEKLASLPSGTGEFKVTNSQITPGTPVPGYSDCGNGQCGKIHWIRFRVALTVPASFVPAEDLQITPVQCPSPAKSALGRLVRLRPR
ncbi:MAG: hypothetical protein ACR2IF_02260 [Terriglobales bacterium]